jgi:NitT/TauT family transport system ATP-binding protein
VQCSNLTVKFRGRVEVLALRNVSFHAAAGEFVCITGPSGCGKTTLLRTLAGSVTPDAGRVASEARRPLLVRQEGSVFPWLTVLENAAFGLEMQGVARAERERAALPWLTRLGLGKHLRAFPNQLSVGMKQRVAVVQAWLAGPDLLLMDEPFAALDCQTRRQLQMELLELWQERRTTVVFVTHDVDEALLLADRLVVMRGHPGEVAAELEIDVPRANRWAWLLAPGSQPLKRRVWAELGFETGALAHAAST